MADLFKICFTMDHDKVTVAFVFTVLFGICVAVPTPKQTIDLKMPGVRPSANDEVLCHSTKIDGDKYITSFVPKAKMSTAHHMLLFACEHPGMKEEVWRCGEMEGDNNVRDGYRQGSPCKSGQERIIYAWAMDAPPLTLPTGVGFGVGGKAGLQYLVLQVHYKNASKFIHDKKAKDNSGITMTYQTTPTPKLAGVYLFATDGLIPRGATVHMETACSYNNDVKLHPFAFRTHTHKLGKVVSGYRIRNGKWTELGRKSPQLPQMFYNTSHPGLVIEKGDMLAARCVMKNFHKTRDVAIGATQNDEMCNFYLMFWVPAKDAAILSKPEMAGCSSNGWPSFKWSDMKTLSLKGMPRSAAQIPDMKDILRETVNRDQYLKNMMAEMELEEEEAMQRMQNFIRQMEENEEVEEEELRNSLPLAEEDYSGVPMDRRGVPFFDLDGDEGYDEEIDPVARNLD